MKIVFYVLVLSVLVLNQCKPDEDNTLRFTFNGQIIDATTNEVPVGLAVTLQATSSPDLFTKFKKEILGTAITESMGRFSITYKKTSLPVLTLLSQFLTYNDLPINKNVDTVFYRSTKGTLVYKLTATNPLNMHDTIYLGIPPKEKGEGWQLYKLAAPLLMVEIRSFKILKTVDFNTAWGIGYSQYDSVLRYPNKFKNHFILLKMRGDPYVDSVNIIYR